MAIDIRKNRSEGIRKVDGRYVGVAIAIAVAFFVSYAYASSARTSATPAWASSGGLTTAFNGSAPAGGAGGAGGGCCGGGGAGAGGAVAGAPGGGATGGGGGCCGGGGAQKTVKGATTVAGGLQKVTIDLTTGSYSPNEITAKAGVPLQLDFKGPAKGCNGYVQSQQLGFSQDMSNGGTIQVAALQPGTYTFACSMNMYTAKIIVK
ncbi:MAG TPA: cupredoxin domain-containing protein [Coriobacteriia bacterium]|jgi:hypothetical protein